MLTALKIITFLLLAFASVGAAYCLQKGSILKKLLKNAYAALDEASVERAGTAKRNLLLQQSEEKGFWLRLLERPERRFTYSRMTYVIHMPFELWTVLKCASAALLYFILMAVGRDVFTGLTGIVLYLLLLNGMEFFLAYRNYKSTDENLIKLINLMSNFSATSGEITGIFHQVSRYLPDPLGSVLEECYYDAQTCGDTSVALYAMADKIEHPMFKSLIRNIEVCVQYTANFSVIIDNSRRRLLDEQKAKRERKSMATENLVEMAIISAAMVLMLVLVELLLEVSVWQILLHTMPGHIAIAVIGACYLIFGHSFLTAER